MQGMNSIEVALARAERQKNYQRHELEASADTVMRKAELEGRQFVVLTAAENTALLSWIRKAEEA